jgi:hypothetical protein
MAYLRTDVLSLFDLDFQRSRVSNKDLESIQRHNTNEKLRTLYESSFEWLFYGSSLPGLSRFYFPGDKRPTVGSCLTLHPEHGIGVFTVWSTYLHDADPLQRKHSAWDGAEDSLRKIYGLGLDIREIQRHYPFVSVLANTDNLTSFCRENAVELGRLFTGNYEYEDEHRLAKYVDDNISTRGYERLFVRWTEALAVYADSADDKDKRRYEQTLCRALQVYETCVLVERLLRKLNAETDRIVSTLAPYRFRPWAVNNLITSLLNTERTYIVSPPVSSVEAQRLLQAAFNNFGIPHLLESAKSSVEFLEKRYQWEKAQFLGLIAVVAWLAEKL